jgi:hypothetical protein
MPQVQQAFQSIHAAAVKAERAQVAAAENAEKAKTKAAEKWAEVRRKIQERSATMAGAFYRQQAAKEAAEAAKAEKAKVKAARDRASKIKQEDAELDAWYRKKVSEGVQAFDKAEKAKAKAIRDRIASTKQAEKELSAWQHGEQRKRDKEERANRPGKDPGRNNSARGRFWESVAGGTARSVVTGLRSSGNIAMSLANTTAQLGGGFDLAGIMERQVGAIRAAANVSSSSISEKVSSAEVLRAAKPVAIATGMDLESVVGGIEAFRKPTGQTKRGMALVPELAKISTVFGANLEDLGKNAGGMAMSGDMSDDDILKMLRVQAYQGSVGAVELPDFARYGQRITAAARMYGGDRASNIGAVGAAAQIAMQSGTATTPAEATMSALRISTDIAKKHDKLKKEFDIETLGEDGKTLKSLPSIVSAMLEKTGGRVDKITQLGIGDRGDKFLQGAAAIYRDAGGGAKGQKRLQEEWDKFTGVTVDPKTGKKVEALTDKEVDRRFGDRMAEADKKLEGAFNELRIKAGEELLPVFIQMIPALRDLLPQIVDLAKIGIPAFTQLIQGVANFAKEYQGWISFFAAHPIGSLIAKELTQSFLTAQLPALLRALFSGAFGAQNVPGASGGHPGANGASRAAGLLLAGTAMNESGSAVAAGTLAADDMAARVRAYARGDKERGVSPEQAALAIQAARGRVDDASSLGQAKNIITGGLGISDTDDKSYKQYKADQALVDSKELQKAIAEAAAAGVREGVANGLKNNSGADGAGRSETIAHR